MCGTCDLDEHTIVDLQEPKELQDFSRFGGDFIDTAKRKGIRVAPVSFVLALLTHEYESQNTPWAEQ